MAGAFLMGPSTIELGRSEDETQGEVTLTNEFYLSKTEVTWSEWTAVLDRGIEPWMRRFGDWKEWS